jgi:hypothetical protein
MVEDPEAKILKVMSIGMYIAFDKRSTDPESI